MRERHEQGQEQHDRHLDDQEQRDPAERRPELGVLDRLLVVVEADERVPADERLRNRLR
jgi:hypothetical protein